MISTRPSGYARKNATTYNQLQQDEQEVQERRRLELQRVKETQRRRAAMRKAKNDVAAQEEARRQKALDDRRSQRSTLSAYMRQDSDSRRRPARIAKPKRATTTTATLLPGRFCASPVAPARPPPPTESIPEEDQLLLDSLDLQTTVKPKFSALLESADMVDSLDLDHTSVARRRSAPKKTVRWALSPRIRSPVQTVGMHTQMVHDLPSSPVRQRGFDDTKPLFEYLTGTGTVQPASSQASGHKPSRIVAPGHVPLEPKRAPRASSPPPQPVPVTCDRSVNWRLLSSPAAGGTRASLARERERRREHKSNRSTSVAASVQAVGVQPECSAEGVDEASTNMFLLAEELAEQSCLSATHILRDLLEPQTSNQHHHDSVPAGGVRGHSGGSLLDQCQSAEAQMRQEATKPMGKTLQRICSQEDALMRSLERLDVALLAKMYSTPAAAQQPVSASPMVQPQAPALAPTDVIPEEVEQEEAPRALGVEDFGPNGVFNPSGVKPTPAKVLRPVASGVRKKLGQLLPPSGRIRRGGGKTNLGNTGNHPA